MIRPVTYRPRTKLGEKRLGDFSLCILAYLFRIVLRSGAVLSSEYLHLLRHIPADLQRGGGGGGGGVADMQRVLAGDDQEVVGQLAVGQERLGAHACGRRDQVFRPDLRDEALQAAGEGRAAERAPHLLRTLAPVPGRQPPEAAVRECVY